MSRSLTRISFWKCSGKLECCVAVAAVAAVLICTSGFGCRVRRARIAILDAIGVFVRRRVLFVNNLSHLILSDNRTRRSSEYPSEESPEVEPKDICAAHHPRVSHVYKRSVLSLIMQAGRRLMRLRGMCTPTCISCARQFWSFTVQSIRYCLTWVFPELCTHSTLRLLQT